ncbi:hypothetical protein [Streptomyces sp. NBC_01361]|uniref:hypothetical protein n=1 Tax=Streptomyces sp. NBC_01361 TaxID=2903838 RepID=UPI002E374E19|nr:hypothetical protein [Streptomyces sp. NBC_01361]
MKETSRRTVLVGAAATVIALGLPASTAGAESGPEEPPATAKGKRQATSTCGNLGSTRVCVTAREVQDVTGLQYVITNGGARPMAYTVWYVDTTGGPESGRVTETVKAGETATGYFYGAIQHCFTLHVCEEAGTACITLGPVCGEEPAGW